MNRGAQEWDVGLSGGDGHVVGGQLIASQILGPQGRLK